MKTNLKILYKTPDLDKLAAKHQDFDALMDAVTDEKIRRRKKLYRFSSFAIVIVATAFLSWLYWGYEPASSEQAQPPKEVVKPNVAEDPGKDEPQQMVPEEEVVQRPEEANEQNTEGTRPTEADPAVSVIEEKPEEAEESEVEEMAMPQVTISRKVSRDAEPEEGLEGLYLYLYGEINLPDSLLGEEESLFFEVEFTVEKDGDISNITLSKELPVKVDSTLKVIFENMPKWNPAIESNEPVMSSVKLPITFQKKNN